MHFKKVIKERKTALLSQYKWMTSELADIILCTSVSPSAYLSVEIPNEVINNNPLFTISPNEIASSSGDNPFPDFSPLDFLGRCGINRVILNHVVIKAHKKDSRNIRCYTPAGWHSVKYDNIKGGYCYHRCHLIGHQFLGQLADRPNNLITGTRELNILGMLTYENKIAKYLIKSTNHIYYSVIPIFERDNLLPTGVIMFAKSIEENEDSIQLCVYCPNIQPGIRIDYATGNSHQCNIV